MRKQREVLPPSSGILAAWGPVRHWDGRRRGRKPGPSTVKSRRLRRWGALAAQPRTPRWTGLGGGGSTLKTARSDQGEPNPTMEATDPITRRRNWGRTSAWDPVVLLLNSDGLRNQWWGAISNRGKSVVGGRLR
jgi:hypothetical protein